MRGMAHVVEFVERRCCLYGVCVILGPLKHKRDLCLRLFLVNMSTRTPRQLCSSARALWGLYGARAAEVTQCPLCHIPGYLA